MLGIDNFEGGVVGAEEESDSGGVVGIRNGIIQDIVDDPLFGESSIIIALMSGLIHLN